MNKVFYILNKTEKLFGMRGRILLDKRKTKTKDFYREGNTININCKKLQNSSPMRGLQHLFL